MDNDIKIIHDKITKKCKESSGFTDIIYVVNSVNPLPEKIFNASIPGEDTNIMYTYAWSGTATEPYVQLIGTPDLDDSPARAKIDISGDSVVWNGSWEGLVHSDQQYAAYVTSLFRYVIGTLVAKGVEVVTEEVEFTIQ